MLAYQRDPKGSSVYIVWDSKHVLTAFRRSLVNLSAAFAPKQNRDRDVLARVSSCARS